MPYSSKFSTHIYASSQLNVVVASISQHGEIVKGEFFKDLLRAMIESETDNFVRNWDCKIRFEPYNENFVEDNKGGHQIIGLCAHSQESMAEPHRTVVDETAQKAIEALKSAFEKAIEKELQN